MYYNEAWEKYIVAISGSVSGETVWFVVRVKWKRGNWGRLITCLTGSVWIFDEVVEMEGFMQKHTIVVKIVLLKDVCVAFEMLAHLFKTF